MQAFLFLFSFLLFFVPHSGGFGPNTTATATATGVWDGGGGEGRGGVYKAYTHRLGASYKGEEGRGAKSKQTIRKERKRQTNA